MKIKIPHFSELVRHTFRVLTVIGFFLLNTANAAPDGAALYSQNCAACHKINEKLVGPALGGVENRHSEEWLIKWIRNSQAMIASGDAEAVKIATEYNNLVMPAYDWSDEEIKAVLAYIKEEGAKAPAATAGTDGGGAASAVKPSTAAYVVFTLIIVLLLIAFLFAARILQTYLKTKGKLFIHWNNTNAGLMLVFMVLFFGFVAYNFIAFTKDLLPEAASIHGVITDELLMITVYITMAVFILTHILLFVYTFIYRHQKGRRAFFFHDNMKLEIFWTVVPAIVLATLVLYGFNVWKDITQTEPAEDAEVVELFAYQFGWIARYPGADGVLGSSDYRKITTSNKLGLDEADKFSADDKMTQELVLPVNRAVLFKFRAKDVIHSAYMPHFRVQMNVVPGMPTQFHFVPTITTEEMRKKTGNPDFNYELACNKICGAAHFNMRMKITVVSEEVYAEWVNTQKTYFKTAEPAVAQLINN